MDPPEQPLQRAPPPPISPKGEEGFWGVSALLDPLCHQLSPPHSSFPKLLSQHWSSVLPQPHNCFPRSRGGFWAAWACHRVGDILGLSCSRTSSRVPNQGTGTELVPGAALPTAHPAPQHPHRRGCKIFLYVRITEGQKAPRSPFCLPRAPAASRDASSHSPIPGVRGP